MKELLDFCGDHPWLFLFSLWAVCSVVAYPFKLINRWIRHRNIVAAGWPPFHLDGDGDTRSFDEDDIAALKAGAVSRPHSNTPEK